MYSLYNILLFVAAFFILPYYVFKMLLTGKNRKSFGQRFGFIKPDRINAMVGAPRIWIHAVSVGEVTAAAPIIAKLRIRLPSACIILSTVTETGHEMAGKIIPDASAMIYFPLDIPFVIRKVLDLVKPDLFTMIETELWPNFIQSCVKRGVKVVLVNGRISPNAFKRYKATRFFWGPVLRKIDEIAVISAADAEHYTALGAAATSIHIFGNAKYDSFAAKASPDIQKAISEKLNLEAGTKVLVAGSTHEGEEEVILTVYNKLLKMDPDFKLIMIPRHIERAQAVITLAKKEGFKNIITMSEINKGKMRNDEGVIIVDVIGELFKIYSLATVAYCGGSLVPKGGQNILEPAAWGKVVFFGPHMEDFQNEKALMEASGAGITVQNGEDLFEKMQKLLKDPEKLAKTGEEGRQVVVANVGASQKYADLIIRNLP